MNLLFGRVGQEDEEIAALIDASNRWAPIASQETSTCAARPAKLGPTLRETRVALEETGKLAEVLGPALNDLRPFARRLKPVNGSLGKLARETTGDVRNRIRPFTRAARGPVRDLRPAAANLNEAGLTTVGRLLNKTFNMAAYNPSRSEAPDGRRGLPVLARLARPVGRSVLAAGRRRLPQALSGLHLRRGGRHPGHQPARPDHRPRPGLRHAERRAGREEQSRWRSRHRQQAASSSPWASPLVLRPAPLPLGDVRRRDPLQAGELQDLGRLPRGDHPPEGGRRASPASPSARSRTSSCPRTATRPGP